MSLTSFEGMRNQRNSSILSKISQTTNPPNTRTCISPLRKKLHFIEVIYLQFHKVVLQIEIHNSVEHCTSHYIKPVALHA